MPLKLHFRSAVGVIKKRVTSKVETSVSKSEPLISRELCLVGRKKSQFPKIPPSTIPVCKHNVFENNAILETEERLVMARVWGFGYQKGFRRGGVGLLS